MENKKVRFDQLKPYFFDKTDAEEYLYDLGHLLRLLSANPHQNSIRRVFGDIHLFHICKYDEVQQVWEIQVLRLREKILPGIADTDGAYDLIQLEDGKYPAESTTILYDERSHILFFQRNHYGVSIRAMELYLQELSPENTLILLKPIKRGNRISRVKPSCTFRRILLIADTQGIQQEDASIGATLYSTLKSFRKFQGAIVKLELGFGHKNGFLRSDAANELLHEAYDFNGIQKLQVRLSDAEDTTFETIDLLDDRAGYDFELDYTRENPITHIRLYYQCMEEFKKEFR